MESKKLAVVLFVSLLEICFVLDFPQATAEEEIPSQTYIVHVEKPKGSVSSTLSSMTDEVLNTQYESLLSPSTTSKTKKHILNVYKNVVSGFSAQLTAEEGKSLQQKEGVLSVRPEKILELHTTRTPSFLGLKQNSGVWKRTNYGKGMIIGVLDTGITLGHDSFSDEGMSSPPAKWKGKCELKIVNVSVCNKKLIGLRSFITVDRKADGQISLPIDDVGHGTHTASTAAGNFVKGASMFGSGKGTAVGVAPLAHVAMYKVCDENGCPESVILAGMDAAVEDGVDILSLSIGGKTAPFYDDAIAIGAYGAMQKGVFVSCSAGNSGPLNSTLSNEAPWILTVGASTIDRRIQAVVKLGNSQHYEGESSVNFLPLANMPLVFPSTPNGTLCLPNSLRNLSVSGKIVLCVGGKGAVSKGQEVKDAGGSGMILMNDLLGGFTTLANAYALPALHVSYKTGMLIQAYIKSQPKPTATISFKGTTIGDKTAPAVSFFSSRGPSTQSRGILKPDLIGPGVNILAAWPNLVDSTTNTISAFNIISGTSMSCPHLSGVAALVKTAHRKWTPAAIKSAIMTTTYQNNLEHKLILDEQHNSANLFATGAGHVNPSKALSPGLVYNINPDDYIPYLCGLKYTSRQVAILVQQRVDCSKVKSVKESQLNYPSFSIVFGSETQTHMRTVTNVGPANSTYTCKISPPPEVGVVVKPSRIAFTKVNQKVSYFVTFTRKAVGKMKKTSAQGSLSWSSNQHHTVRSPISVIFD